MSEDTRVAVIMAGGRGERLRPLTDETPKPLIEVGGKPVIQWIIEHLWRYGFERIFVLANYKAEQIKARIDGGEVIVEPEPLGPFAGIRLLDHEGPILIWNGDVLARPDLDELWGRRSALMVKEYRTRIPYGVVEVNDDGVVVGIDEKPHETRVVGAGVAKLDCIPSEEEIPRYLPRGYATEPGQTGTRRVNTLADAIIWQRGEAWRYGGEWHDIGTPETLARAREMWR